MGKIHFACLFGVEYELDIMPYWTAYYLGMKLDSYKLFLHSEHHKISGETLREFRDYGFEVESTCGIHGNGTLRKIILSRYAETLPPDDLLVTADADEFQCVPEQPPGASSPIPPDYRSLEKRFDIVSGFMIDRYTSRLESCYKEPLVQYEMEEPYTRRILHDFTPPCVTGTKWPLTRRTKILAARAGYRVGYEGSHCLYETPATARIIPEFKVLHFTWRESMKRKVLVKPYFTKENVRTIMENAEEIDELWGIRQEA